MANQSLSFASKRIAVALTLVFGLSMVQVFGQVRVEENEVFYHVTGTSGSAILASVRARQLKAVGASHAIAVTRATIEPGLVQLERRNNRCHVVNAELVLKLDYTYPIWANSAEGNQQVLNAWQNFTAELANHEIRHAEIAVDMANKEYDLLRKTTTAVLTGGRCADLGPGHRTKVKRIRNQAHRKHLRFDHLEARPRSKLRKLQAVLAQAR